VSELIAVGKFQELSCLLAFAVHRRFYFQNCQRVPVSQRSPSKHHRVGPGSGEGDLRAIIEVLPAMKNRVSKLGVLSAVLVDLKLLCVFAANHVVAGGGVRLVVAW